MERYSIMLVNGPRVSKCIFELKKIKLGEAVIDREIKTPCEYSFHVNYLTELNRIEVAIRAKMSGEELPFHFDVTAEAQVRLKEKVDVSEVHRLGLVFGGPYVFAILRDFIMSLTRKAYINVFVIPPIDFDAVAHLPEADKIFKEAQKTRSSSKRKETKTAKTAQK